MLKKVTITLGATLFFAFLLVPSQVDALSITPAIREISLTPGAEKTAVIEVENDMSEAVELTTEVVNFTAKDNTGEPLYDFDGTPSGIATWIHIEEGPVTLQPGQIKEYTATFTVPANAQPGGHYAGVIFNFGESTADAVEGQLIIESKVGIPFLATVTGSYIEKGEVMSFGTVGDATSYTKGPVSFGTVDFKNTGDIHLEPTGSVVITNMFGKTVKTIKINVDQAAVLPDSTRSFETGDWADVGNGFGKYTATITMSAGAVTDSATVSFWILSTMGIVIAVVIVVILIVLIVLLAKKRGTKPAATDASDHSE